MQLDAPRRRGAGYSYSFRGLFGDLEKSVEEVLARRARVQVRRRWPHESPPWHILARGHGMIGNEVATDRIKHIRALRHTLAHQRGELRTEEMRKKFAVDFVLATDVDSGEEIWDRAYVGGEVQLPSAVVSVVLDDLSSPFPYTFKPLSAIPRL